MKKAPGKESDMPRTTQFQDPCTYLRLKWAIRGDVSDAFSVSVPFTQLNPVNDAVASLGVEIHRVHQCLGSATGWKDREGLSLQIGSERPAMEHVESCDIGA